MVWNSDILIDPPPPLFEADFLGGGSMGWYSPDNCWSNRTWKNPIHQQNAGSRPEGFLWPELKTPLWSFPERNSRNSSANIWLKSRAVVFENFPDLKIFINFNVEGVLHELVLILVRLCSHSKTETVFYLKRETI